MHFPENPAEFRNMVYESTDRLETVSSNERGQIASWLAQNSKKIHSADRSHVLSGLRKMIVKGPAATDFTYGLWAFSKVAANTSINRSIDSCPLEGTAAIRTVFELCAAYPQEKSDPEHALKIAFNAINKISRKEEQLAHQPTARFIVCGNTLQRRLALKTAHIYKYNSIAVLSAVAHATMDPDEATRADAKNTLIQILAETKSTFPKHILFAESPGIARQLLNRYLGKENVEAGHLKILKSVALTGASHDSPIAREMARVFVERRAIKEEDVPKGKWATDLLRLARQIEYEVRQMDCPEAIPPNFRHAMPKRAHTNPRVRTSQQQAARRLEHLLRNNAPMAKA